jgi:glycosyltransferase involved in cell wall biosynthesis
MSRRRRLLVLAPFPPDANGTHGGARALGELLDQLAGMHDVLLAYVRGPGEQPITRELRERLAEVEELRRPDWESSFARRTFRMARRAAGLAHLRPVWVTDWTLRAVKRRVRELALEWQPEIVQAEFHIMAQYLRCLGRSDCVRVAVEHETGVRAAADRLVRDRGLRRAARALDLRAWRRYERSVASAADAIVVFTEADRDALLELAGRTPVVAIPLGTFLHESPLSPHGTGSPEILFAGSFVHPPNVDAAERLARSILPGVLARRPDVSLVLAGDSPPGGVWALAGPQVHVTGRVHDVRPYLDRATVVAVPIRFGGGMRVKVLEALEAGKAIVASPRAVEGLHLTHGDQLLIAETDAEFTDAVVSLMADAELRAALAASARAWALEHLGWNGPIAAYEELWATLRPRVALDGASA